MKKKLTLVAIALMSVLLVVGSTSSQAAPPMSTDAPGTQDTVPGFSSTRVKSSMPDSSSGAPDTMRAPMQAQGPPAVVVSVDQPESCLRVRSGPGSTFPVVGCLQRCDRVTLADMAPANGWAKIVSPLEGWVYRSQIGDSCAPRPSGPRMVMYEEEPAYFVSSGGYYPYWRHRRHHHHHWGHHPHYKSYSHSGGGVRVRVGSVGVRFGSGGVGVRVGGGGRRR